MNLYLLSYGISIDTSMNLETLSNTQLLDLYYELVTDYSYCNGRGIEISNDDCGFEDRIEYEIIRRMSNTKL